MARYNLRDHLGSVDKQALTVGSGTDPLQYSFDAFGKRRNTNWTPDNNDALQTATLWNHRGYTDHEQLDNVRLIHMNGRVYDPKLGRFISADPVLGDPGDPQSLNPYSYVMNNPLTFTDPSGFAVELCGDNRDCIDVIWEKPPFIDITGADRSQYADPSGLFGRYAGWYEGMAIDNALGGVLAAVDRLASSAGQFGAILRREFMPGPGPPTPEPSADGPTNPSSAPEVPSGEGQPVSTWKNPTGRNVRGCDPYGCGEFGANREYGPHRGADFEALPGQDVYAVASGTVDRIGNVYGTGPGSHIDTDPYKYVAITTASGEVRQLYVRPAQGVSKDVSVKAGDVIGQYQTLQRRYPGITDHVHVDIQGNGRFVDPVSVISLP